MFHCENVKVGITYDIGGYPGHYDRKIAETLRRERPQLFVCGHSHIAKVKYDQALGCLHINSGAAGQFVRFTRCGILRPVSRLTGNGLRTLN